MKWFNLGCCIAGGLAALYLFLTWRFWEAAVMCGLAVLNGWFITWKNERPRYNHKSGEQFKKGGWGDNA